MKIELSEQEISIILDALGMKVSCDTQNTKDSQAQDRSIYPKNCTECLYALRCRGYYGGNLCKYEKHIYETMILPYLR